MPESDSKWKKITHTDHGNLINFAKRVVTQNLRKVQISVFFLIEKLDQNSEGSKQNIEMIIENMVSIVTVQTGMSKSGVQK